MKTIPTETDAVLALETKADDIRYLAESDPERFSESWYNQLGDWIYLGSDERGMGATHPYFSADLAERYEDGRITWDDEMGCEVDETGEAFDMFSLANWITVYPDGTEVRS